MLMGVSLRLLASALRRLGVKGACHRSFFERDVLFNGTIQSTYARTLCEMPFEELSCADTI